MTTAQNGLAKALARGASGEVIALAELPTADLLASLSDEQKAELSAALPAPAADPAAAASDDMPTKKKDGCSDDEDEDDKGGEADPAMQAAATDRVKVVANAVATDDACKGKAGLALSLLADDDFAELNGNALVKLIGKTAVDGAEASGGDPEAAARDEMKAALALQGNSSADADGGAAPGNKTGQAATTAVWDKAIARVFPGAPA